jgi:hypothetical protein
MSLASSGTGLDSLSASAITMPASNAMSVSSQFVIPAISSIEQ